jgi:plasmid maintenance system antidote protein VapI
MLEDIVTPRDMSVNALAKEFHISATRLNEIVRGRRDVTADTGSG